MSAEDGQPYINVIKYPPDLHTKGTEMQKYAYTDEPLTEQDWELILNLNLPKRQIALLAALRERNGDPIPVTELVDKPYFRVSHPEQINARLSSTFKVPYRLGAAGCKTWGSVLPREARALKLYKVRLLGMNERNPGEKKEGESTRDLNAQQFLKSLQQGATMLHVLHETRGGPICEYGVYEGFCEGDTSFSIQPDEVSHTITSFKNVTEIRIIPLFRLAQLLNETERTRDVFFRSFPVAYSNE
jgi:hypothetical protein